MRRQHSFIIHLLCMLLVISIVIPFTVHACKDIIATGNATEGENNLLLKVRDPSRPGLQVLVQIPKGYEYTYHHPWTGEPFQVRVNQSYIGVTSQNDIPPNIVKPGMVLTEAGLAYGDADSRSRWINPTKNAWDDFDWIRYSCEQASNEEEAVKFLTSRAVDELHATGVSENLCVIGPKKGYLIEADAFQYSIKEIIDDVDVISNYPRTLWNTQLLRSRFIASTYDAKKTDQITTGQTIHLNGIARIHVLEIKNDSILVKQIPFFTNIGYHDGKPSFFMPAEEIKLSEQRTVGDFYVSVQNISEDKVTIDLTTAVHAWEQDLMKRIMPQMGNITVSDMISWSRIQAEDVNDLRPMCEATYPHEGVAIYQIPKQSYRLLSKGWFSPNHAVSSIYVPFHNSNTKIYTPYKSGDAARLSLSIYQNTTDQFLPIIKSVEEVFLTENAFFDTWAYHTKIHNTLQSKVLTTVDTTMQEQAWLMTQFFFNILPLSEEEQTEIIKQAHLLWNTNYTFSFATMTSLLEGNNQLTNNSYLELIQELIKSTCTCYITATEQISISTDDLHTWYDQGLNLFEEQHYAEAIALFQRIIKESKSYFTINQ